MKKVNLIAALTLGIAMTFAACKKDENKVTAPVVTPGPYTSLSNAFADVAPKSKKVTLNAGVGGSFYGNSGTRFVFPANAFQTMDGKSVSGSVDIEVLECTKESDMIFARMLTMSNGEVLISGGSFSLKASQAGAALKIAPYIKYSVNLPTNKGAATAGMSLFSGVASDKVPGTDVNWNLRMDSLTYIVYDGDTIRLYPDSTGFVNVDKYSDAEKAHVNIKIEGVDGSIDSKELAAYYLLDGLMSAISYSTNYGGTYSANEFKSVNMVKLKAHIVVCTVYKGEFYAGTLSNITAADGASYTVTLSKTTPIAFKTIIDGLN